mgnify:CR=1 FL=1|jgi:hypothetical protein
MMKPFFNNACVNPNLMIDKSFGEIVLVDICGVIEDVFFEKTNLLMPTITPHEIKPSGEPWLQHELPSKFEKLWEAYA